MCHSAVAKKNDAKRQECRAKTNCPRRNGVRRGQCVAERVGFRLFEPGFEPAEAVAFGAGGCDSAALPADARGREMMANKRVDGGDLLDFFLTCLSDFLLGVDAQAHGHFVAQVQ